MSGHIGVYIGGGLAVECSPKWENCVQITACNRIISGYNTRTWTKHGKIPYVSYTGLSEANGELSNPDSYSIPTRTISYKAGNVMTGSDVSWVQAVLYQLGYTIDIDGSFGPKSKSVLTQFQSDNALEADGICGPATRGRLKEYWDTIKSSAYTFSYDASGGSGDAAPFTVGYAQTFTVSGGCTKDGCRLIGWNVKRNNDGAWRVDGVGWCSESDIKTYGYTKSLYADAQVCTLDSSWTIGLREAGSYTFYAVWEGCSHSYELTSHTEATCASEGLNIYTCSLCKNSYSESIPTLPHSFTEEIIPPTADSVGYTLHTCSECGYSYKDNETDFLMGDVNGDGKINTRDMLTLKKEIAGTLSSAFIQEAADLNGDGKISSRDMLSLRKLIANT